MNSFARYLRPVDLAAQLRMERQSHKGAFLIFEGSTDLKRFKKLFSEDNCSFVIAYGRENVEGLIEIEDNDGRVDALGFVDADFDYLIGNDVSSENIIRSALHDYDLVVFASNATHRYLDEVISTSRPGGYANYSDYLYSLLKLIKPLSAARYANERYGLRYRLSDLDMSQFCDGRSFSTAQLVNSLSYGRFSSEDDRNTLTSHIEQFVSSDVDLWQVTNGHDVFAALGLALRNHIARRSPSQTKPSEIEMHLRLAFDSGDFAAAGLANAVRAWEQAEQGRPCVLR